MALRSSDDRSVETGLYPGIASRRQFLRTLTGGALAVSALPLLSAACGPAASTPAAATPGGATSTVATNVAPATTAPTLAAARTATSSSASGLPTYSPYANKPNPDFPSKGPQFEDGYLNYPANPVKSQPATPPGSGSTILATLVGLYPPPTPVDQNPAWQAVNKALNVDFRFDVVPLADYVAKVGTLMAGGANDLPDILCFFSAPTTAVPNVPAYLQHSAADLTPYLAGDAIKDYPSLAAIPTYAWRNSGAVINGHVYGVPLERWSAGGSQLLKNTQMWDAHVGEGYVPKSADDFKRVLQELTQPDRNVWGFGGFQGAAYNLSSFFVQVFGAPNNWMLDSSGKLVKDIETDQYKQAVGYVRELVSAGVMDPDSDTISSQTAYRDTFLAGKLASAVQAFGNNWFDVWSKGQKASPRVDYLLVDPFPAQPGAAPVTYLGAGYNSLATLKAASPERIQEILRVMNWLAAPFGSQEDLLLTDGLAGTHYNLDANGNPVTTPAWNADVNNVPWRYVVQHPQVIYFPGAPDFVKLEYNAEQSLLPPGVADPSLGLPSPTNDAKGTKLNLGVLDTLGDLVAGRRPLSDYDPMVKDWQSNGGEQIRAEFQQQLASRPHS
ncbi:MAG: hypothetical protein JOZ87_26640 [Chloroflexi bacterium]|nr:hypothetical protein [Chloroflexota bacterium]